MNKLDELNEVNHELDAAMLRLTRETERLQKQSRSLRLVLIWFFIPVVSILVILTIIRLYIEIFK